MLTLARTIWIAMFFVVFVGLHSAWAQDGPTENGCGEIGCSEQAQPTESSGSTEDSESGNDSIWTQPTLITRPWLAEYGITFGGFVSQHAVGVAGGIDNPAVPSPFLQGDRFGYFGRGEYDMYLDLDKVARLPHGKFLVRLENWWGQFGNVSLATGALAPANFPDFLPPAPNDEGRLLLSNFIWTQPLHQRFVVFAGKKDIVGEFDQDKFAGGDGTDQFMNQALIANPSVFISLPYSSFTTGFAIPGKDGRFVFAAWDPENRIEDFIGDDLFAEGFILIADARIRVDFWDKPGHQSVGLIWKNFDQPDLRTLGNPLLPPPLGGPGGTKSESWVLYWGFDQHLQVYSQETYGQERGWGLFGRLSLSDGNPNPVRWFGSLGIGGDSPFGSPFHGRKRDTFGVGWFYTGASDEFGPVLTALVDPTDGWGVEAFYNFEIVPWMHLTPDVQLLRPGALNNFATDLAFVGGFRLKISL